MVIFHSYVSLQEGISNFRLCFFLLEIWMFQGHIYILSGFSLQHKVPWFNDHVWVSCSGEIVQVWRLNATLNPPFTYVGKLGNDVVRTCKNHHILEKLQYLPNLPSASQHAKRANSRFHWVFLIQYHLPSGK
jgi:hypothetical protein